METVENIVHRRDRLLLRPWLENMLATSCIPGLEWYDKDKMMFRVPWKHRSKKDWSLRHSSVFLEWARNTGRWSEGDPAPYFAQLKTRLRCAFNKAPDIEEMKDYHARNCEEPYKVYRFTTRSDLRPTGRRGGGVFPRTTVPMTSRRNFMSASAMSFNDNLFVDNLECDEESVVIADEDYTAHDYKASQTDMQQQQQQQQQQLWQQSAGVCSGSGGAAAGVSDDVDMKPTVIPLTVELLSDSDDSTEHNSSLPVTPSSSNNQSKLLLLQMATVFVEAEAAAASRQQSEDDDSSHADGDEVEMRKVDCQTPDKQQQQQQQQPPSASVNEVELVRHSAASAVNFVANAVDLTVKDMIGGKNLATSSSLVDLTARDLPANNVAVDLTQREMPAASTEPAERQAAPSVLCVPPATELLPIRPRVPLPAVRHVLLVSGATTPTLPTHGIATRTVQLTRPLVPRLVPVTAGTGKAKSTLNDASGGKVKAIGLHVLKTEDDVTTFAQQFNTELPAQASVEEVRQHYVNREQLLVSRAQQLAEKEVQLAAWEKQLVVKQEALYWRERCLRSEFASAVTTTTTDNNKPVAGDEQQKDMLTKITKTRLREHCSKAVKLSSRPAVQQQQLPGTLPTAPAPSHLVAWSLPTIATTRPSTTAVSVPTVAVAAPGPVVLSSAVAPVIAGALKAILCGAQLPQPLSVAAVRQTGAKRESVMSLAGLSALQTVRSAVLTKSPHGPRLPLPLHGSTSQSALNNSPALLTTSGPFLAVSSGPLLTTSGPVLAVSSGPLLSLAVPVDCPGGNAGLVRVLPTTWSRALNDHGNVSVAQCPVVDCPASVAQCPVVDSPVGEQAVMCEARVLPPLHAIASLLSSDQNAADLNLVAVDQPAARTVSLVSASVSATETRSVVGASDSSLSAVSDGSTSSAGVLVSADIESVSPAVTVPNDKMYTASCQVETTGCSSCVEVTMDGVLGGTKDVLDRAVGTQERIVDTSFIAVDVCNGEACPSDAAAGAALKKHKASADELSEDVGGCKRRRNDANI